MDRNTLTEWITRCGRIQFTRSGGPGGQNINTRSTQVILSLDLDDLPANEQTRAAVKKALGARLSSGSILQVRSSSERGQLANRRSAEARAFDLIHSAARPRKHRRKTRPGIGAKERRLKEKKHRGGIKAKRSRRPGLDD